MNKWLFRISAIILPLAALAMLTVGYLLNGSLATLSGEIEIEGLSAPVFIDRDKDGTVTVRAKDEMDMALALGYVHGQERFFEMDLLRRTAAGELSELFGSVAIKADKNARVHRLRARVESNLSAFALDKFEVLEAYTKGVNQGLKDLSVRPWPYLLLQDNPKPWKVSDSALVGYAMFFDLQDENNKTELALWKIKQVVPQALYDLLAADGTKWDAPLIGEARGDVKLPGPDVLNLRELNKVKSTSLNLEEDENAVGSNNFAVSGALTKDGRAIVADDMHLGLRAPNIWFRAKLLYHDNRAAEGHVDVSGFTLPGLPGIIVGSNTHVAWAFTNSYGDWLDWHVVHPDADVLQTHTETIKVKGGDSVKLEIRESNGRPILAKDIDGSDLSLSWVAHLPGSINAHLFSLAIAKNTDEVLELFDDIGMPHQNAVVGDRYGKIAWTLTGLQKHWSSDCNRDEPFNKKNEAHSPCFELPNLKKYPHPKIVSPNSERIWTANARVTDHEMLKKIGDGGYDHGARAKQIRDALFAKDAFREKDLFDIQLDDRSLFMKSWWKQLRLTLKGKDQQELKKIEELTRKWDERASTDAVSYRFVRTWRRVIIKKLKESFLTPAKAKLGKSFIMPRLPQFDGVASQLVVQKPIHLLPLGYSTWDEFLDSTAIETAKNLSNIGDLEERNWGEQNTTNICHPLAGALPNIFRTWLCMPEQPQSGDHFMPLVSGPNFGASQRMVVAPGREEDGIIHMPGGQSGHILSPFWGAGHHAWATHKATPFLPGETIYTLKLSTPDDN